LEAHFGFTHDFGVWTCDAKHQHRSNLPLPPFCW
jgi:hypothetical protein